jgi:hypothetical protein
VWRKEEPSAHKTALLFYIQMTQETRSRRPIDKSASTAEDITSSPSSLPSHTCNNSSNGNKVSNQNDLMFISGTRLFSYSRLCA